MQPNYFLNSIFNSEHCFFLPSSHFKGYPHWHSYRYDTAANTFQSSSLSLSALVLQPSGQTSDPKPLMTRIYLQTANGSAKDRCNTYTHWRTLSKIVMTPLSSFCLWKLLLLMAEDRGTFVTLPLPSNLR